jgi:hypothetical protein
MRKRRTGPSLRMPQEIGDAKPTLSDLRDA